MNFWDTTHRVWRHDFVRWDGMLWHPTLGAKQRRTEGGHPAWFPL
jgi:hypothetical protein